MSSIPVPTSGGNPAYADLSPPNRQAPSVARTASNSSQNSTRPDQSHLRYSQPPVHLSHLPPPYDHYDGSRQEQHPYHPGYHPQHFQPPPPPGHHHPHPGHPGHFGQPYPAVMVYPPPPPPGPAHRPEHPSSASEPKDEHYSGERRGSVQLPSMVSWAPPPLPSRAAHASPRYMPGAPPPPMVSPQERRISSVTNDAASQAERPRAKRRSSDDANHAQEVEAGIALAGLGLAVSAPTSANSTEAKKGSKRVKKEPKEPKEPAENATAAKAKGEKDNKKSCSECRRLKAKCDRVFPCSNCRRRGCALVCPDGDLSCMQGKRLVLASTEQLHERIALLESALSQSHAKVAPTSHPLLAPQYLDGGFVNHPPPASLDDGSGIEPLSASAKPSLSPSSQKPNISSDDHASPKDRSSVSSYALLTPKLGDGPSADIVRTASTGEQHGPGRMAVENLLLDGDKAAPEGKREDEWVGENAAPAMIVGNCGQNPSTDHDEHRKVVDRLRKILRILPPRDETRRRAASFWENSQWYNSMLKREEFESIYEPAVYSPTPNNPLSPHKLACVLMVLTLDTYFDLAFEEDNPRIAEYWEGAQQCFDTRFGWAASVAGVQALALATLFVGFGWRGARASNFYWLRQMTSAAQQLGLHKDPHHSLPEDERDFRRRVFWDCYTIDCLMSINHGQRSAIPLENIETLMPDRSATLLHKMKYEYMRTVKTAVIDIGCRPDSSPASWQQITAVDQVLMQYDVRLGAQLHCPVLSEKVQPPIASDPAHMDVGAMTRSTTSMCHFKAMMFLYRPSLRRLIARLRNDRAGTLVFSDEDRQVVSMSYGACRAITQTSIYMSRTHPRLSARCWAVWVQTFSAAVSMAALAIWCGPHLEASFIASAYKELSEACDMIRENGSKRSQGVLSLLPVLQSLVHNRYPQVVGNDPSSAQTSVEGEDMLFALLGGQVDQRGVSPPQGNLMNPPFAFPKAEASRVQQDMQPAPQAPLPGSQEAKPVSIPDLESIARAQAQANAHAQGQGQGQASGQGQGQSGGNGQVPTQAPYIPISAQYNTMWQDQMMALPIVAPHPSTNPLEGFTMPYQTNNGMAGMGGANAGDGGNGAGGGGPGQGGGDVNPLGYGGMNTEDLWARLQTFYEPTPAYWGQSVGAVGPGGYVDYSGMAMGM